MPARRNVATASADAYSTTRRAPSMMKSPSSFRRAARRSGGLDVADEAGNLSAFPAEPVGWASADDNLGAPHTSERTQEPLGTRGWTCRPTRIPSRGSL